jgi:predicted nuclease of predicted toxin-antitoxin system
MKFKVDENLPVEAAESLRHAGHDAVTVTEQHLEGSPDLDIAFICQEEERALITLETDFADIRAYPPKQYPGLIVLRLRRQDKHYILKILDHLITVLSSEQLENLLWIVDETHIRIRG